MKAPAIRGRTAGVPFHQIWNVRPALVVDPDAPDQAVVSLLRRVRATIKARGCGVYVYANPETMQVYVISEERIAATLWLRDRPGWLVGFYQSPASTGEVAGQWLRDDLAAHLGLD